MDRPAQRLSRRLQLTRLAFFLLAILFLVVMDVAAPSIYTNTLLLIPSLTGRYPAAAMLLLIGIGGFLAIVMVGVLRRWRSRVLARASGLHRNDPRYSRNDLAAGGDPSQPVPGLVPSVSDGHLLNRSQHCRVDAPYLLASWSVGPGKTGQSQAKTPAVTR
jgi:hypothetical protein